MSNLYTATQNLTKAVQEKAKKLGLEIEIENYLGVLNNGTTIVSAYSRPVFNDAVVAIQAPQIRQILLAFQEALENDLNEPHTMFVKCEYCGFESDCKEDIDTSNTDNYISKAEALCAKYLDGLNPMFDREPIQVLEELTEIINNI
jgi:hypothetical protein